VEIRERKVPRRVVEQEPARVAPATKQDPEDEAQTSACGTGRELLLQVVGVGGVDLGVGGENKGRQLFAMLVYRSVGYKGILMNADPIYTQTSSITSVGAFTTTFEMQNRDLVMILK